MDLGLSTTAKACSLLLAVALAGCGNEGPEPTVPSQTVSTDLDFSFDQPPGWREPSKNASERFETRYAKRYGLAGTSTTLESLHSGAPEAILNVTVEAAPPGIDAEEALGLNGEFPDQSEPRSVDLDGDETLVVTTREAGQDSITKIIAITVHDGRIVGLIFSTLEDTPIEPLEPDADEIFASWRWAD